MEPIERVRAGIQSLIDQMPSDEKCNDFLFGEKSAFRRCLGIVNSAEPEARELTMDELRGMDGEPVWCVPLGNIPARKPHWVIIDYLLPQFGIHYGETWLAYSRKPKEGV